MLFAAGNQRRKILCPSPYEPPQSFFYRCHKKPMPILRNSFFIDISSPISLNSGIFSLRKYDKRNHSKTMGNYQNFPVTCYILMIICTKSRFVFLELMPDRSCKSFKIALSTFLETFKPESCTIFSDR